MPTSGLDFAQSQKTCFIPRNRTKPYPSTTSRSVSVTPVLSGNSRAAAGEAPVSWRRTAKTEQIWRFVPAWRCQDGPPGPLERRKKQKGLRCGWTIPFQVPYVSWRPSLLMLLGWFLWFLQLQGTFLSRSNSLPS